MPAAADNLPADRSSYIGRANELTALLERNADARLLTIVGPGGVGKSRLAVRLGASLRNGFPDGVWLTDLAPLTDPSMLPGAVAATLGAPEVSRNSTTHALTIWLRARLAMLILDNCESQVDAAADLAVTLLRASPGLHLLATSREPLGLEGEVVWRVPLLSVPAASTTNVPQAMASEAVQLFVARAKARSPEFELTQANVRAVVHICRRLGGLPLALEVVAARVPSLGLRQIATRLDTRYALRLRATREAPARQRSLRASLDWSYRLLSRPERMLLRRLSIFVGGWTLEAAEAVCSDSVLPPGSIVDVLDGLISCSLVLVDLSQAAVTRYRLLDMTRQYALELLQAAGEQHQVSRRHAEYMLQMAMRVHPARLDPDHAAQLEREQGNLRAALRWALQNAEAGLAQRLGIAIFPFWYLRSRVTEGQAWLTRCLALPAPTEWPAVRPFVGCLAGHLSLLAGDLGTAQTQLDEALATHRSLRNQVGIALANHYLSLVALWRGEVADAGSLCDRAEAALDTVSSDDDLNHSIRSAVLTTAGRIALELDEDRRASVIAVEAERVARRHNNHFWLTRALHLQALLSAQAAQYARALLVLRHVEGLQRSNSDGEGLVDSLCTLGHTEIDRGRMWQAREAFVEAMSLAEHTGQPLALVQTLEGFARALAASQPEAAVRLAGACEASREAFGCTAWPTHQRRTAAWLADARAALGPAQYASARTTGWHTSQPEAVRLVYELVNRTPQARTEALGPLTPREDAVAVLLAQGMSNKKIAAELSVSVGTIRAHVDHILLKLGLHSRTQVAMWAIHRDAAPGQWSKPS
jgi:predicted ATPase/DNA-binding CsgD family transcriptional regulator